MGENAELVNNEKRGQFEMFYGGSVSKIKYEKKAGVYHITHVGVPENLEGEGIGALLMEKALEWIKGEGSSFSPSCTFAKYFVEKNPQWKKIMTP